MINKKTLKVIIPVIAVLVLVESVVLVSRLEKVAEKPNPGEETKTTETREILVENQEEKEEFTIKLAESSGQARVGEESYVDVLMSTRQTKNLDAISVYVGTDPQKVSLERVEIVNSMPKPVVAKISKKGDVALVNYLISNPSGFMAQVGSDVNLLRIFYTPISEGTVNFNIIKEGSEAETMLVETGTSQVIPFNSRDLSVSILK